jgi:uncharacterized YccA/Bax inhibitor family protein
MDKSSNPALSDSALDRLKELAKEGSSSATITGTTLKALLFLSLTFIAGFFGWQASVAGTVGIMYIASIVIALVAGLVTAFKPAFAAIGGAIYSLAMGYALGITSQIYNTQFDGIVLQAIGLTGAIFFVALWFFQAGLIKVTNKFRIGVIIATLGVFLFYGISFIITLFGGTSIAFTDGGTLGIIISVVVVFIATLNLFLDFDLIQRAERDGMPKQFEWYGAFALVVTIIWLYIEALRLLGRLRG